MFLQYTSSLHPHEKMFYKVVNNSGLSLVEYAYIAQDKWIIPNSFVISGVEIHFRVNFWLLETLSVG